MPWVKVIWGAGLLAVGCSGAQLTVIVHGLSDALAALVEHVLSKVNDLDLDIARAKLVAGAVEQAQGNVTGAAGNVEALEGGRGRGLAVGNSHTVAHGVAVHRGRETREHGGDKVVLPQPVDAERHRVVHNVILGRDRREDTANWDTRVSNKVLIFPNSVRTKTLLFLLGNGLEAKVGSALGVGRGAARLGVGGGVGRGV